MGDGSQINIWLDPWIPDGVTRRPITPRGQTLMTRVSELINPTTGNWDRQLIEEVFWEEDWGRILGIPIKAGMDDLLAWHYDGVRLSYNRLLLAGASSSHAVARLPACSQPL